MTSRVACLLIVLHKGSHAKPHRKGLSVEAALGITVGLDMALAAASLAFMARRISTDILQWAAQKLQPGREKLERLKGRQVHFPVR